MPELPDLQVFSRNLSKMLKGKKVSKVNIPVTSKLNVPPAKLKKAIEGSTLKNVYREGKEMHIEFSNKNVLGLHLMLHGNMHVGKVNDDARFKILELVFKDNTTLALTDWQKAATPTLNPVSKDAPDALSKTITAKFLKEALDRKTTVKNILLDQKAIRGIGNAYADEILWDARIHPFSIGNKIPDEAIKQLAKSIKQILTKAEKQILKADPKRIAGELRDFMSVHNSKKKETPTGAAIKSSTVGGRKTYFTDEQIEYR
jgi:formamidopyrimidine-DNA glycosylase